MVYMTWHTKTHRKYRALQSLPSPGGAILEILIAYVHGGLFSIGWEYHCVGCVTPVCLVALEGQVLLPRKWLVMAYQTPLGMRIAGAVVWWLA